MSVIYSFTQKNIEVPEGSSYSCAYDLILMANAIGVGDDSRMTATYTWAWNFDSMFSDTSVIHMTDSNPVLTIAGDYTGAGSNEYNLSITSTNNRFETAAVRSSHDLRLLLTAQAGAYMANSNVDANITINAASTTARTHQTYTDATASGNNLTALGFDVTGTLTLVSDLVAKINVTAGGTLQGINVQSGDSATPTNTSADQKADAIGIRSAKLVLNRNFNAVINVDATATITGYGSLSVTGNTAAGKGIRVLGNLSATDGAWSCSLDSKYRVVESGDELSSGGEWNGAITATVHDSKLGATKAYRANSEVSIASAAVSNNDVSAYGIWTDGSITIDHLKGKAGTEITASASNTTVEAAAEAETGPSVTLSNNTFSAYGIKTDGSMTLKRVDSTFDINASLNNVTVTGSLTGVKPVLTLSGNKFYSAGIEVGGTLTLGKFDGKVTATTSNITMGITGFDVSSTTDNTAYRAYGIKAGNIIAADNLGGTITVNATNIVGLDYTNLLNGNLEVAGIYAGTGLYVKGRINSTINLTLSDNNENEKFSTNPLAYGIRTGGLVADAFSGYINVDAPVDVFTAYFGSQLDVTKSVGLTAGKLSTGYDALSRGDLAFDINGTIKSTMGGLVVREALNLRVSGEITTQGATAMGAGIDGIAIATEQNGGAPIQNDQLELASTAVVKGNINLFGGENSIIINSGAKFTGKLLADGGEMNIRFDLDQTINSSANVTVTSVQTDDTDSPDITLISTSHITINLNNAKTGTYKLFKYSSYGTLANEVWTSGAKGIAFSYQEQSLTRNVSTGGTASATFTDADNHQVTATLNYNTSSHEVTVTVTNDCILAAFGGDLTTTVDADSKQVTLGWEKQTFEVPGLYEVEYKINGAKSIVVKTVDLSTTIDSFDAGSNIQWRVRRNTANGTVVSNWSDWTNGASGAAPTPAAPDMTDANPTAVDPSGSSTMTGARARLYWNDAVAGSEIIRYEVEGIAASTKLTSTRLAEIYADPTIATADPDITYFTKTTTAPEILASQLPNRTYVYWRVRALDAYGQYSGYADGNMFRVFSGDDTPPTWNEDTDKTVTAVVTYNTDDQANPTGEATLTWPKANDLLGSGIRRYRIDYRSGGAASWQSVYVDESDFLESDPAERSGTITGLTSGNYEYRIYAQDYVGNVSLVYIPGTVAVGDTTSPKWNDESATTADSIVVDYDVTTDPDRPVTDVTLNFGAAEDVEGEVIYKTDSSGNFVYEKDEYGNVRTDADGNPIKIPIYTNHASGVKEYVIEYWTGTSTHKSVTVTDIGAASYSCTLENLSRNRNYSYTITAVDFYGNSTVALAESSITLGDFAGPEWRDDSSSASVAYDITGAYPSTAVTIDFGYAEDAVTSAGHITNPGSGVKDYVIKYWTSDYEFDVHTEYVANDGSTSYTWNKTLEGGSRIYSYQISARDFYNNESLGAAGTRIGDFTAPEWQDETITVGVGYDLSDPDAPKMTVTFGWGWADDVDHTDDESGFYDPGSGVKNYVLKYRTGTESTDPIQTVTVANTGATSHSADVVLNNGERIYSYEVVAVDYYGNESSPLIGSDIGNIGDFTAPIWRDDTITVGVVYDLTTDPDAPEMTATFNWGWAEDVTSDTVINPASGVKEYVLKYWTSGNEADVHTITVADADPHSAVVVLANGERIYSYGVYAVDYYGNESVGLTGSDIGDFTAPEWVDDAFTVAVDYNLADPNAPKTNVTFNWGYAEDVLPEVDGVVNPATGVKEYVLKYWTSTDSGHTVTFANDGSTSYSHTVNNISPNQRYSYSVSAVDYYGNENTITRSNVAFGDFTAPKLQDVGFNAEIFYDVLSDPTAPSISVTFNWGGTEDTDTSTSSVTNRGTGVKEYVLSFGSYDPIHISNTEAAINSYTFRNVAKGDYAYSVYAVDYYGNSVKLAGNTSTTDLIRISEDTVPPVWQDDTVTIDLTYDVTDEDVPKVNAAFTWGYATDNNPTSAINYSSGVKEYRLRYWATGVDETVIVPSTAAESYSYVIENIAPNARYSYSVTAVDFYGNQAALGPDSAIIGDFTKPVWQDDTVTLNVTYNTDDPNDVLTNVTFNWGYAEDANTSTGRVTNPGSGVKEYILKFNGEEVGRFVSGDMDYSYSLENIVPGRNCSYEIIAVDYYGNQNSISKNNIILGDFTAPVWADDSVVITVDYDRSAPNAPTTSATFTWGNAQDVDTSTDGLVNAGSGVKEYRLKYWTSTDDVQTVMVAETGAESYSYTLQDIVPGRNYSYEITAIDYRGNESNVKHSGKNITLGDFTAPVWQDAALTAEITYNSALADVAYTDVTFNWGYAEDADTSTDRVINRGSGVKEYVIRLNGADVAHLAPGETSYTLKLEDITPVKNGSYSIVAVDYYGNEAALTRTGVALGDFTAPVWQDTDVSFDVTYGIDNPNSPTTNVTFNWGYAEDVDTSVEGLTNRGSGVKGYRLKYWTSTDDVQTETVANSGLFRNSFTFEGVIPSKKYSYEIVAVDSVGNESVKLSGKDITFGDFTAPTWVDANDVVIAVSYDLTGSAPVTNATFTWGYAEDISGSGVKEYVLKYWTSTADVQTVTVADTGAENYSYILSDVVPGKNYSYEITAVDYYGNASTKLSGKNITLGDFTAPEWQDDTLTAEVTYNTALADVAYTDVTFNWGYALDKDTTVPGVLNPGTGVKEYVIRLNGADVVHLASGETSYTLKIEGIDPFNKGSYSIVAVDYYGNEAALTRTGVALGDFTAPEWHDKNVAITVSYDAVDPDNPRTDVAIDFSYAVDVDTSVEGLTNHGSGVKEYRLKYWTGTDDVQTVTVAETGLENNRFVLTGVTPSSKYSYEIVAVDSVGNESVKLSGKDIAIGDFTAPTWVDVNDVVIAVSYDLTGSAPVTDATFTWGYAEDINGSGVKEYVLKYWTSTADVQTVTVADTGAENYSYILSDVVPGKNYSYEITAVDYYGNASTKLSGKNITLGDFTAPEWQDAALTAEVTYNSALADVAYTDVTFNWGYALDKDTTVPGVLNPGTGVKEYVIRLNGADVVHLASGETSYTLKIEGIDPFNKGSYSIVAVDYYGNEAALTRTGATLGDFTAPEWHDKNVAITVSYDAVDPDNPRTDVAIDFSYAEDVDTSVEGLTNRGSGVKEYRLKYWTSTDDVQTETVTETGLENNRFVLTGVAPNKKYSYEIVAVDSVGNESVKLSGKDIVIGDFTAPTWVDVNDVVIAVSYDLTGSAPVTNATFTWGSAEDINGSGVKEYVLKYWTSTADVQTVTVADNGAEYYSYILADVVPGRNYSYEITAVDYYGNASTKLIGKNITLGDFTAPEWQDAALTAEVTYNTALADNAFTDVTFNWGYALDKDTTVPGVLNQGTGVKEYVVRLNGTDVVHLASGETSYTLKIEDITPVKNGSYSIVAVDYYGNEAALTRTGAALGDFTAPEWHDKNVVITVSYNVDDPVNPRTDVTFDFSYAEDVDTSVEGLTNRGSGVKEYRLKYWTSTDDVQTETVAETGLENNRFVLTGVTPNKKYSYEIVAVDHVGNESVKLSGKDIPVGDFTPPVWESEDVVVAVSYDLTGDDPVTNATFTWSKATDVDGSGVKEYVLKYWTSTADVQTVTVAEAGAENYSYILADVVPGKNYSYEITAVDYCGNVSTKLSGKNITLGDFAAPEWQDDTLTAEVTYNTALADVAFTDVTFNWAYAVDKNTSVPGVLNQGTGVKEYVIRLNGVDVANVAPGETSYTLKLEGITPFEDGSYSIVAVDYYGNEAALTRTDATLGDFTAPEWYDKNVVITVSYIVDDPDNPRTDVTFDFSHADDVDTSVEGLTNRGSGVKEYRLKYWTSTDDVQTVTVADTGLENNRFVLTGVTPSSKYFYEIVAVDYIGNESVKLSGADIPVGDFTPPVWENENVGIVVSYDVTGVDPVTNATFTWSKATDVGGSGVKEYRLKYWMSTADVQTVTVADTGAENYSYILADVVPGKNYSYEITAVDYCGNVSTKLSGKNITLGDFAVPKWQDDPEATFVVEYNTAVPDDPVMNVTFDWVYAADANTTVPGVVNSGSGVKEYILNYWTSEDVADVHTVAVDYTGTTTPSTVLALPEGERIYAYEIVAVDYYGNKSVSITGGSIGDFIAPEWQDDEVTVAVAYDTTVPEDPAMSVTFNWGYAEDVTGDDGMPSSGVKAYRLTYRYGIDSGTESDTISVAAIEGEENYEYTLTLTGGNRIYSYELVAVDYYDNASESITGGSIGDFTAPEWQDDTVTVDVSYDLSDPDDPILSATFNFGYAEDVDASEDDLVNPGSGVKEYRLTYWYGTDGGTESETISVENTGAEGYSLNVELNGHNRIYAYEIHAVDYYGNRSDSLKDENAAIGDFSAPVWQDANVAIAVSYDVSGASPVTNALFSWASAEDIGSSGVKEYVLKYWTTEADMRSVVAEAIEGKTSYTCALTDIDPSQSYSYEVVAVDYYGNVSSRLSGDNITFGDFTKPVWRENPLAIEVTYDVSDADVPVTNATFTLSASDVDVSANNITDPGSGVQAYVLKYWTSADDVQTVTVANTGMESISYTLTDINPSLNYSYEIFAVDFYGNESTRLNGKNVTLGDFAGPEWRNRDVAVDVFYNVSGDEPVTNATFSWGYAEDADKSAGIVSNLGSGVKEYVLKYGTSADNVQTVTVASTGATSYSYTLTDLARNQNYSYAIYAVDFYGKMSEALSGTGITIGDFTKPVWKDENVSIAVAYDVTGTDPVTNATFSWGYAEDADSGVKEYVLKYWTSTDDVQSVTVASTGATSYSWTLTDIVRSQNYSYSISAVDYYGNEAEIGATGITLGDFAKPEWEGDEVIISIAYDVTNAGAPRTDATFYWDFAEDVDTSTDSITNPGSGVKEYVLKYWTSTADVQSVTVAKTAATSYSCTLTGITPSQNYSYAISAVDYYGNESVRLSGEGIKLGDFTAPEWQDEEVDIAVAYDLTDASSPKTNVTFNWGYAEDVDASDDDIINPGAGVKEYVLKYRTSADDATSVTVAAVDGAVNYDYTVTLSEGERIYSYEITALDYYNNESASISGSGMTIGDFTAPEWQDEEVDIAVSYDVSGASPVTSATFTWGYAEDVTDDEILNPASGVKEYVLRYWTNADEVQSVTVASTDATSYSYTLENIVPSESYSYSITAVDYFGNETAIGASGIVLGDFTAPEWKDEEVDIAVSYDVSGASPVTNATFSWGYAEDVDTSVDGLANPGSGVKEYVLKYWTSTEDVKSVTVASTGATSYSYAASDIARSESLSYLISAVDYFGHVAEISGSSTTVGDFTAPEWQDETVTVTENIDRYDAFNVKLDADFSWTAASDGDGSGVKEYVLEYKLSTADWSDGSAVTSVTVSEPSASVSGIAYSLYDYRIQGFDYYGNTTSYLEGTFGSTDDVTPPTGSFDLAAFATAVIGEWTEITTYDQDPRAWVGSNDNIASKTVNELTGLSVTVSWEDSFADDSGIVYTVEFANSADFLDRTYSFTQARDTTTVRQSLTLDNSLGNSVAVLAGMDKVYYRISVADGIGNVNPLTSAIQSFEMVDSVTGESVAFSSDVKAPVGLRASSSKTDNGKSRVKFSWSGGANLFGVHSYTLNVTTDGKTATYTGITDTEYTLTDQSDGTYTWTVVANSGSGSSALSEGSSFVLDATSPLFPDGASASVTSSSKDFVITWTDAVDANGIQGYVVRYGSGTDTSKWVTASTTTSTYIGSITADGTYNYVINAVDKYGNISPAEVGGVLYGKFTVSSSNSHDSAAKALPVVVTSMGESPSIHKGNVGLSGSAEWLSFTVDSNNSDVYIYFSNVGSSYKSGSGISVKGYSAGNLQNAMFSTTVNTRDNVMQIRCAKAGTYYLAVTPKKSKSIMDYSVSLVSDVPTAAMLKQGDNTWNGYDSAAGKRMSAASYSGEFRIAMPTGTNSNVSGTLLSDYVGSADAADYRRLDVATAGSFNFKLDGIASPLNLTVYSVKYNYVGDVVSVKAVKTVKLKPKYNKTTGAWVSSISTGNLMLESGSYYIAVTAPKAGKNQNSRYTVSVNGTLFTKGNNSDDNWSTLSGDYSKEIAAGAATTSLTLFADEWVGFGDSVDYRKLTINQAGSYNFAISGVNTQLTMTVYSKNDNGTLSKVKSVSVKSGSGAINGLMAETGTYYVEVKAKNTQKGNNTNYKVQVTGSGVTKANNADDAWANLPAEYTISGTTSFSDWVGFGDAIDYRKINVSADGGLYTFRLSGMSNKVKMSVYAANGNNLDLVASVTGSSDNSSVLLRDLCLSAGTKYYLAVEAPGAAKAQNSNYKLEMTEEGTFDHRNNNSWAGATLATGDEFEFNGLLTKSSGGDDVDFISLKNGDFDTLSLDMKSGKAEISFYDANHNAVKAASVTFKNGSTKTNVASVSVVADNPVSDSIRLSDLDDAIKYLRIDAASTGADSYLLKLA